MLSLSSIFLTWGWSVCVCVGVCMHTYTQTACGVLNVSPGVGRTPGELRDVDRLKCCIHVVSWACICVQSHGAFFYIYAGLRDNDSELQ